MIEVDLKNKPKELWKLNPYGKVPVLVDGEVVVYESAVINEYLEEKFPQVPLMPKDLGQRARVRIWIGFCNSRPQQAGGDFRHGIEPEKAKEKLKEYLLTLDREMASRDYIAGDYSLADITYIPFFARLESYGVSIDGTLPHLKAWIDRLFSRPAVSSTP